MSELGNRIRELRGKKSQRDLAEEAKVNVRTIQRIEDGEEVTLATLRTVVKHLKVSEPVYAELLVAWLKQEAGNDAQLVTIECKPSAGKKGDRIEDQLYERVKKLPTKYQTEVLAAMESKELLDAITHLNLLYTRLKNPKV
jgi:transcriptional regulator with XRE-family HTH domain